MKSFFIVVSVVALITTGLAVGTARAAPFTIDQATDSFGPVGDFYLVEGNNVASSPGNVIEVLGGPSCCLQGSDPESETRSTPMGDLWDVLDAGGLTSASKLVFGFGNNQTGSLGTNFVDITALTMSFVLPDLTTKTFSLGSNNLVVYNYVQGQSTAEARIGVDLGFDFLAAYNTNSLQSFTISSTIANGDDGFEIYFLSSGFTSDENLPQPLPGVPEPGSLMLLGSGLAAIAGYRRYRRRRA